MNDFLNGAAFLASAAVALYFLRFWRDTRDALLGIFAVAFGVFSLNRLLLAIIDRASDARLVIYVLRLFAFLLIIAGILVKNYGRQSKSERGGGEGGSERPAE